MNIPRETRGGERGRILNTCTLFYRGTAVAQWLRCCATNRKVPGSIPAGVIGNFHLHKILPIALWPWGLLSISQEHFLEVKAAGVYGCKIKKVKKSRYRPGVTQRVPDS